MGRLFLAAILGAPFLGMNMIATSRISSIYALYFVSGLIPFVTAFFLIFGVADIICLKSGLYDDVSFEVTPSIFQ